MIAITEATGGVGGRVARDLAARGLSLRLVVRDASRAPDHAALDAGELVPPSDTVQRLLGRPPRTLADGLREHPASMAHLRG
jgi:uncharacterized protein YbjT (DUF2867 family)